MKKAELEVENEELRDALAETREHLQKLDALLRETLGEDPEEDPEEDE